MSIAVPTFESIHNLSPFMIAPTAIIRGAGITFGIPIIDVEGTTGYYNSNLDNKFAKALELFKSTGSSDKDCETEVKNYDFGFIHIKAVDDAGHDKNLGIKIQQLEKIDKCIQSFIEGLTKITAESENKIDFIVCVTGDHTTPVFM